MIYVTRLSGDCFAVNPDLIERIEPHRGTTTIVLVDDTRYLVTETGEALVEAIRTYRASILALANQMNSAASYDPEGGN